MTRAIPSQPLLEVSNLQVQARSARGVANAVDGVSFSLRQGEVLGLIGESGSGKSLTCLSLIRLNPKPGTRITGGAVHFSGADLLAVDDEEMRAFRGRQIAMVLQDPMTALNPVLTIADQIGESLNLHQRLRGEAQTAEAERLLTQLRVPNPKRVLKSYPHQLSGGMRQRVVSAIALAGRPRLLIADEPTTALDVTVQAAYLKLLRNLQRESGLAVLFVTHDLAAIARICDRVAVMYGGRIVELADVATIFRAPKHPYTQGLLQSVPNVERPPQRMEAIPGHPPTIFSARKGCLFAPRCPEARAICSDQTPENVDIAPGHEVACWARRVN